MVPIKDLTNKKFGRLTVVEITNERDSSQHVLWKCKCDCGNPKIIIVRGSHLTNGRTKSCGCLHLERSTTHGASRIRDPRNKAYKMFFNAKRRAEKDNVIFDLEFTDIVIPDKCPVLNIPLKPGIDSITPNSPTLDRILPEQGYVKENVWVISHRANFLKNNATVEELEALTKAVRKVIKKRKLKP